ncbi:DinB family protein [Actinocrispum sp. NPDC049592]|uniref:DinB family protein n=1 Tax=Actinocrispum sp. NPDC049592 TaxID=3154835 RepID=UPI003421DF99
MSWTAPEIDRPTEPCLGDERAMLLGWLEYHRATLLWKCAGLTGAQLATQSTPPSDMSLLGLIRHMTDVERTWFLRRIQGQDSPFLFWTTDGDTDFSEASAATAEEDYARLLDMVEQARKAMAGVSLEDTIEEKVRGTMSVRWVLIHMIEEYARHNGHADLIRERIDGKTGD